MQSIQVVRRAVRILELVAEQPETPRSLTEIAARAGLSAPTCSKIIGTLVQESYVEQIAPRKGYILGPMAYALAARGPYRKDLVACAQPAAQELAAATGETVLVAILHRHRRFMLLRVDGTQAVQVRPETTLEEDIYATATGRLLLANLPDKEREEYLAAAGLPKPSVWPKAATKAKLRAELREIRRAGCEFNIRRGEVAAIAFAIRERDRVVAALGLYLPAHRCEGKHHRKILDGMVKAAATISRRLSALRDGRWKPGQESGT